MKTLMRLLIFFVLYPLAGTAANTDSKFGKVPIEELRMSTYDKDPEAYAVILYEDTQMSYQFENGITQVYDYRTRIKILKSEGCEYSNVLIPYAYSLNETITGIDAAAYNLEEGKVVKTAMKKEYVFREQVSQHIGVVKFSIPEVKVGSVIEYRYRRTTSGASSIYPLTVQHEIPSVYCHALFSIPEFFVFNYIRNGYVPLRISEQTGTMHITYSSGAPPASYITRDIVCKAHDIPAIKSEPFVWCPNDHLASVDFELTQIVLPGRIPQSFSSQWEDINDYLAKSPFQAQMSVSNPYKEEVAAIKAKNLPSDETLRAILRLVQSKITWNGSYSLFSSNPHAAADKGTGNSADVNFILSAAIRDAGFSVTPVLLNPRSSGRMSRFRASLSNIRTFILRIDTDGEAIYLDATSPFADLNIIPINLQVQQARIYGINDDSAWVDLSSLTKNTELTIIEACINPDSTVTGKISCSYNGLPAMEKNKEYNETDSENKYIESLEKDSEIEISDFSKESDGGRYWAEQYNFCKKNISSDRYIYLNPILAAPIVQNPFSTPTRTLPVEMKYPATCVIRATLQLPEGWTIDELPENCVLTMADRGPSAHYIIMHKDNTLQVQCMYTLDRIFFFPTEHTDLSGFFSKLIQLTTSQVVLKKE